MGLLYRVAMLEIFTRHLSVAVPFFFGSMSILEGKPHEAVERIRAVTSSSPAFSFPPLTRIIQTYFPTLIRNWSVILSQENFWVELTLRLVWTGVYSFLCRSSISQSCPRTFVLYLSASLVCSGVRGRSVLFRVRTHGLG